MSRHPPDEDQVMTSERFDYFMIRLTRTDQDPDRVAGLVERLGSGEKRSFETGDQLLRMVGGWFASTSTCSPRQGTAIPVTTGQPTHP